MDNPQSNGLNERLNQTLVNRIRCRINEEGCKEPWSKSAQKCAEEYNKTVHTSTRFSPSYLLYGEKSEVVPNELQIKRNLEEDRRLAALYSEESFKKK